VLNTSILGSRVTHLWVLIKCSTVLLTGPMQEDGNRSLPDGWFQADVASHYRPALRLVSADDQWSQPDTNAMLPENSMRWHKGSRGVLIVAMRLQTVIDISNDWHWPLNTTSFRRSWLRQTCSLRYGCWPQSTKGLTWMPVSICLWVAVVLLRIQFSRQDLTSGKPDMDHLRHNHLHGPGGKWFMAYHLHH